MIEFRMPSLGADMEDGTLVEWLVKPGDRVKRGDVVAVVETQKGAIEIESFQAGIVSELAVPIGQLVPVGTILARLDGVAEAGVAASATPRAKAPGPSPHPPTRTAIRPAPAMPRVPAPLAGPQKAVVSPPALAPRPIPAPARPRVSPAARLLAEQNSVDVTRLRGTGPDGAITRADVEAAVAMLTADLAAGLGAESGAGGSAAPRKTMAEAATPLSAGPPKRRTGFDPAAMRQAIAAAMSRSKREIPHYYLGQTIEVSAALAFLERLNGGRAPTDRVLPAALFLRAIAVAITKSLELNGYWEAGRFRPGDGIHIGWAIALRGGGLVAPAIRDADQHSLDELMVAMRDVVARARGSGLRGSELTDPTITVTSLGDRGAESVLPIIHPPQVAMLGLGRVVNRPWVVGETIAPRPVVTMTLAGDHRASDGHRGGLLLAEIDRLLREPEAL